MAIDQPQIKDYLTTQLVHSVPMATDARFVFPIFPNGIPQWLTRLENQLAKKAIASGLSPIAELATTQVALGAVDRLISRGLLGICSFTPTDAAHITGQFSEFDKEAALLGAQLLARQRNGNGDDIANTPHRLAKMTLAELHRQSAIALMDAALAHDGSSEAAISSNPILSDTLGPYCRSINSLVSVGMSLNSYLIALGASANTHYPAIARPSGASRWSQIMQMSLAQLALQQGQFANGF